MSTASANSAISDDRLVRLGQWCLAALTPAKRRPEGVPTQRLAEAPAPIDPRAAGRAAAARAAALGATFLLPGDALWPTAVDSVGGPPGALFVWGALPAKLGVGIVGSRHATASGLDFARSLASDLAADGWPIVSGGAIGVDGAAHEGALSKGQTVAVLGSGLDDLYPPQHGPLFRRIAEGGGAVVSEFPFGTPPLQGLFPRRNRLIAALSQVVVVVEAARRSGSLGTARHAIKLGRPLLAVPGTPGLATSEGTNGLLKAEEALVCTGADDVRRALGVEVAAKPARARAKASPTGDAALDQVHTLLGLTPRPLDEIAAAAGPSPAQAASSITRLELLGLAVRAPGGAVYRPRAIHRENL